MLKPTIFTLLRFCLKTRRSEHDLRDNLLLGVKKACTQPALLNDACIKNATARVCTFI